jgi:hypothetical protein
MGDWFFLFSMLPHPFSGLTHKNVKDIYENVFEKEKHVH